MTKSKDSRGEVYWILESLEFTFTSLASLTSGLIAFGAYSAFFYYLVRYSNLGSFLISLPVWLVILLTVTSAILMTASFAHFKVASRKGTLAVGGAGSAGAMTIGAAVASCSCSAPLVAPILYLVGLNALEVSSVIGFLAENQLFIVVVLVTWNFLLSAGYLYLSARQMKRRYDSRDA